MVKEFLTSDSIFEYDLNENNITLQPNESNRELLFQNTTPFNNFGDIVMKIIYDGWPLQNVSVRGTTLNWKTPVLPNTIDLEYKIYGAEFNDEESFFTRLLYNYNNNPNGPNKDFTTVGNSIMPPLTKVQWNYLQIDTIHTDPVYGTNNMDRYPLLTENPEEPWIDMVCNCTVNFKIYTNIVNNNNLNEVIREPLNGVKVKLINYGSYKFWLHDEGWKEFKYLISQKYPNSLLESDKIIFTGDDLNILTTKTVEKDAKLGEYYYLNDDKRTLFKEKLFKVFYRYF